MNRLKKLFIVLSSILLLSSICGCTEKNESAEEIIKKSFEAQENIKSFSSSIDMSLSFVSNDSPIDLKLTGNMETISNPSISKADLILNLSNLLNLNIISYTEQEGNENNVYTGVKIGDQITWSKSVSALPETNISPSSKNNNYFDDAADYRLVGKEKINDKDTYHIIGSISKDGMNNILKSFGILDQLKEDEKESFDLLLSLMEKVEIDIWVYTDSYLEAKLQLDMCDLLKSLVETSPETSADFSEAIVTITFDGYNNVNSIEIPQEALDAEESSYEGLLG